MKQPMMPGPGPAMRIPTLPEMKADLAKVEAMLTLAKAEREGYAELVEACKAVTTSDDPLLPAALKAIHGPQAKLAAIAVSRAEIKIMELEQARTSILQHIEHMGAGIILPTLTMGRG